MSSHFRRRICPSKSSAMKIESPLNDRVQSRNFLWVERLMTGFLGNTIPRLWNEIAKFIDRMNSINWLLSNTAECYEQFLMTLIAPRFQNVHFFVIVNIKSSCAHYRNSTGLTGRNARKTWHFKQVQTSAVWQSTRYKFNTLLTNV